MTATDLSAFLQPTFFVDRDDPDVQAFAELHGKGDTDIERAVALYYKIRDHWLYSPWGVSRVPEGFKASVVVRRDGAKGGHCIDKAIVLAACARHLGIPSRLHFANVRNHIGTEALEKMLGTDLLVFHGYCELHLQGRWVAATPAFNRHLCERLGVAPLEFDGRTDSIFQQYDHAGGRFMEYVHDYGSFADIPYELMVGEWKRYYHGYARSGDWPRRPSGA